MTQRKGAWIQTFTGIQFWPMDARVEEIVVEDIAHALAMLCRFNGHVRRFYSVAEHSVYVSQIVPQEQALWGLLHDAAEAYLSDIPSPIKRELPQFKEFENNLLEVIRQRFGLATGIPEAVKRADMQMLATEKRALMGPEPAPWFDNKTEALDPALIQALPPDAAKALFLARYATLAKGTGL